MLNDTNDSLEFNDNNIPKLVYYALQECDEDVRRDLYQSIVLSGGNTLFNGFQQRLKSELDKLCPVDVKLLNGGSAGGDKNDKSLYAVWEGGSALAETSLFDSMIITLGEYEEHGVNIVHSKCV